MRNKNKRLHPEKKYSMQCPKCNACFADIWKECNTCRVPLIDIKLAVFRLRARRFLLFFAWVIVFALGTYVIQRSERALYIQSWQDLSQGKTSEAREEFLEAFREHPVFRMRELSLKFAKTVSEGTADLLHSAFAPEPAPHNRHQKVVQLPAIESSDSDDNEFQTIVQVEQSKNRF